MWGNIYGTCIMFSIAKCLTSYMKNRCVVNIHFFTLPITSDTTEGLGKAAHDINATNELAQPNL